MGKLQDFVRECIINCKASAEINTQSKAEVLLEKFAGHLDENGGGSGGGLPTGGAANQMLVTDADGNAGWQDRTHWKGNDKVVLPETTATVNADLGFAPIVASPGLEVGKEYIVTYNGAEYTCTAIRVSFNGLPVIALGNMGAMDSSAYEVTEEPFIFGDMGSDLMGIGASSALMMLDGNTSASVEISEVVYRKLDKNYMSDGFVPVMIVNITSGSDSVNVTDDWTSDKTFDEIINAVNDGCMVFFKRVTSTGTWIMPVTRAVPTVAADGTKQTGIIIFGCPFYTASSLVYGFGEDGTFGYLHD